jgi:hypothetical protein
VLSLAGQHFRRAKETVRPVVLGLLGSKDLNVVSAASYTFSRTGLDRETLAS